MIYNIKEFSLFYYLPRARGRISGCILFSSVLASCQMQTGFDPELTCLFLSLYIYIYMCVCVGVHKSTYIQQLCGDTGCCPEDLPRVMNDREKWRERVRDICATSAIWWWWYIYIYIYIYIWKMYKSNRTDERVFVVIYFLVVLDWFRPEVIMRRKDFVKKSFKQFYDWYQRLFHVLTFFFSSVARSENLFPFSFYSIFTLWSAWIAKFTIRKILFFFG